jgi:hypothetical protein
MSSVVSDGFFVMYYGSEFPPNHFDVWAHLRGIDVDFICPGKPVDNAHIDPLRASPAHFGAPQRADRDLAY